MDISSKKPYLRGMDVFDEVYDMEKDEAQAALIKNMQPLLKTVDHISAQNLEQNNNYSDINLVEACYCCNHDLKKGMPFSEFYTIYPSIINNMPKEKFKYAASNILDVSQGEIIKRLSASNVLKNLQNLITLRTEAKNNLDSVDYRIKLSLSTVDKAIESCQNDIETKENKYKELSKENETLNSDEEYNALIERNTLKGKADSLNDAISELKSSIQKIDNRIYTLKNKKNLSKEEEIEIKSKTANLTEKKELYSSQIAESEIKLQKTNENIAIIDEEYPSTEILISKKNHAEDIINAYSKLNEAKLNIEIQKNKREEELQRKADVEKELKLSEGFVFKKENYTEEENSQLDYYKLLVEAYKLTQKTKTTGAIKNLVNEAAQKQLTAEIKQIENTPIIQSYNYKQKHDELQKEKQRLNDNIPNLNRKVNTANQELKNLNRIINNTSLEEAKEMVTEYDKRIKLRKEKEKALEIKKKMTVLKTEIVLLESTIEDLRKQKENILALFNNC
ncbi:MAG: hypothetical protein LUG16_06555 [Candidatus Gastranaerophilales bacterium]|nr:hypothetical protein [Candidatus Gastranaerophilales bacterium]